MGRLQFGRSSSRLSGPLPRKLIGGPPAAAAPFTTHRHVKEDRRSSAVVRKVTPRKLGMFVQVLASCARVSRNCRARRLAAPPSLPTDPARRPTRC